jgi:two-component system CheB/CheR fusion protein
VLDSGNGIPELIRDKIFQPYFTTKKPEHGTGIGLSLSKEMIENQKGRLYLDLNSEFTCFVIELPKYNQVVNQNAA